MSEISYAIYCANTDKGGKYNVLSSFSRGLLKGFKEANLSTNDYEDCIKNNINFDIAIGFNVAGAKYWQDVIQSGRVNIIWSVDSIFAQNAEIFNRSKNIPNIIAFCVTAGDYEASKLFLPGLKYMYMPHATDKDLWKKKDVKKENDIVLFASIEDYEKKLNAIKEDKMLYSIVNELIAIFDKKPNLSFWDVYVLLNNDSNFNLDYENYKNLYNFVTNVVENKQKIKMIQALSDFNVKIFGSELWKKYIKGKVQYMGSADIIDSVDIMNKSKINLHCHPPQLNYGLHERFLNSASVGTFNLVSDTDSIKNEFKDSFGYFNHGNFEDIAEVAGHFLNDEDLREQKAFEAMEITHNNHLWKNRAEAINELFKP